MADGVGSWADYPVPVDAGVYARMLMGHAKAAAATTAPGPLAPLAVMRAAHSQTLVQACYLPSLTCARLEVSSDFLGRKLITPICARTFREGKATADMHALLSLTLVCTQQCHT